MIILRWANAFLTYQSSRSSVAYKHLLASSSSFHDALDECWMANSLSVNPSNDTDVDTSLQGLCSPAPQSLYVLNRALSKHKLGILNQCTWLLKPGYEFQVRGDDWRVAASKESSDWCSVMPDIHAINSVLELAHKALDVVVDASERQVPIDKTQLLALVQLAKVRISTLSFCLCFGYSLLLYIYITWGLLLTPGTIVADTRDRYSRPIICRCCLLLLRGWCDR